MKSYKAQLKAWLAPPVFSDNQHKTRRARVLNAILLGIMLCLAFIAAVALPFIFREKLYSSVLILILSIAAVVARGLLRRERVELAGFLTLTAFWSVITVFLLFAGGMTSVGVVFYFTIATIAGMSLGPRGALLCTLLSSLAGLGMVMLKNTPYAPTQLFVISPTLGWIYMTIGLLLMTLVLNLVLQDLNASVVVAQHRLEEREQSEEALRQERDRAQLYLDIASVMFIALDAEGRITLANQKACQVLQANEIDLLGQNWFDTCLPESTRGTVRGVHQQLMQGAIEPLEFYENEVLTRQGEQRLIAWHNSVLHDEDGSIIGSISSGEDITDRRRLERQLRHQEQLAAVGQLAGGIAHDFRNLLAVILLYAQMDLARTDLPARAHDHLNIIIEESHRATDLVQQILDFSSQALIQRSPLDLADLVTDIANRVLRRTIPEAIDLSVEIEPGRGADAFIVEADPGRIQQVLTNLALNARDAIEDARKTIAGVGKITFALASIEMLPDAPPPVADMAPGRYVRLTVADTGCGMTDEVQAHLFEPFFTTKDVDKGSGLGLAQVFGIVRQHEGYIDVETAPGQGSSFHIYLPRADVIYAPQENEADDHIPQGRGESILVVEDAQRIRDALNDGLTPLNYRILTARDGRQALDIVAASEVDLVLTDLVMPRMSGRDLLRALQSRAPHLRVIAMTGYVAEIETQALLDAGFSGVITKPFTIEDVATLLRDALDRDG